MPGRGQQRAARRPDEGLRFVDPAAGGQLAHELHGERAGLEHEPDRGLQLRPVRPRRPVLPACEHGSVAAAVQLRHCDEELGRVARLHDQRLGRLGIVRPAAQNDHRGALAVQA